MFIQPITRCLVQRIFWEVPRGYAVGYTERVWWLPARCAVISISVENNHGGGAWRCFHRISTVFRSGKKSGSNIARPEFFPSFSPAAAHAREQPFFTVSGNWHQVKKMFSWPAEKTRLTAPFSQIARGRARQDPPRFL